MEHRAKFNLIENIENWKAQLLRNPNMTYDNVCELESHLLDEIDALKNLELTSEECFLIAKNRVGSIAEITSEFGKVNKAVYFRNKIIPYIKGMLVFIIFIKATQILTSLLIFACSSFSIGAISYSFLYIASLTILSSAVFILYYWSYRRKYSIIKKLNSIPTLMLAGIIGFAIRIGLSVMGSSFGETPLHTIFEVFLAHNENELLLGLVVLTFSLLIYYFSKRDKKIIELATQLENNTSR